MRPASHMTPTLTTTAKPSAQHRLGVRQASAVVPSAFANRDARNPTIIVIDIADEPALIETWFRHRGQVEERIKDSELDMVLGHLPSSDGPFNRLTRLSAAVPELGFPRHVATYAATRHSPTGRQRTATDMGWPAGSGSHCIHQDHPPWAHHTAPTQPA